MHGQTPAGWYADPAPGSPPTRQRYFDGAEWTTNIHDSSPRLSAGDPFSDPVPDGLEAGSGFLAGLVGGVIGAVMAVIVSRVGSIERAEPNVHYFMVFGAYGAVLGAALLAAHAAKREPDTVLGWLVGGALVGGVSGGMASLALIHEFARAPLAGKPDPETVWTIQFALVFGALGLCLGLALGAIRGGGGALWTGLAGAVAGLIGGPIYVQMVLFSNIVRSRSDADTMSVVVLTFMGAAIGLFVGGIRPSETTAPAVDHSYSIRMPPPAPPALPMPVLRWGNDYRQLPPEAGESVLDTPIIVERASPAFAPIEQLAPAAPAPRSFLPPPPPPPPKPRYSLVLDDGRTFAVDGRIIIGRDPQRVRREDAYARLVNVDDPANTVSDTHISINFQDHQLFVEDRGSVNGSAVISPQGEQTPLAHATPVQVYNGWTVVFGTRRAQVSGM